MTPASDPDEYTGPSWAPFGSYATDEDDPAPVAFSPPVPEVAAPAAEPPAATEADEDAGAFYRWPEADTPPDLTAADPAAPVWSAGPPAPEPSIAPPPSPQPVRPSLADMPPPTGAPATTTTTVDDDDEDWPPPRPAAAKAPKADAGSSHGGIAVVFAAGSFVFGLVPAVIAVLLAITTLRGPARAGSRLLAVVALAVLLVRLFAWFGDLTVD